MISFKVLNLRAINQTKSLCLKFYFPQKSIARCCAVRRAVLYVPANDQRKIHKALSLKADCIAFDLWETVHRQYKKDARASVKQLLDEGNVSKSEPEWCVRINPVQTGSAFQLDIDAVLSSNKLPAAIILPCIENCEHLQWFTELVWKKLTERDEGDRGPISLILLIGSPRGVMTLEDICQKAFDLATMAPIVPSALGLDCENLLYNTVATKTTHGVEFLYSRQKLVLVAKAFGLQALDICNTNPQAIEKLTEECKEGNILGFTGKQVIFPNHVAIVQDEFSPSRSQIKRAKMVVREFRRRETEEVPSALERIPTDLSSLKIAEYVINTARMIGKLDEEP